MNEPTNAIQYYYTSPAINIVIRIYDSFFAAASVCFVWSTIDSHPTIKGTCFNVSYMISLFITLHGAFSVSIFLIFDHTKCDEQLAIKNTLLDLLDLLDMSTNGLRQKVKFGYFCFKTQSILAKY